MSVSFKFHEMRELHAEFGIVQICTARSATESTMVEIFCIRYPENINVLLTANPNCQSSSEVNRQFLRQKLGRAERK